MRAIRGAICAGENTREAIYEATHTLLREIVARNGLERREIVSVFFTMTPDLDAEYPAYAARDMGWTDVPMLGAVETPVPGALARAIRVLVLADGAGRARHVYLGRAVGMRPDLAEPEDGRKWNGLAHETGSEAAARLGTLLVVGLGLVGASLAGGARRSGLFARVLGADPDAAAAAGAQARGLVDGVVPPGEGLPAADLVVLAAPLRDLPELVRAAGAGARDGAVITDVGSLKAPVVRAMDELPARVRAVGGHPMAGRERAGVEAADPRVFEGAPWALVPTRRTDEDALERVRALVEAVGARPVIVGAEEHDRAVAVTSHLPALVACALALTAGRAAEARPAIAALVGPGFRSATRLAAAPAGLTADLLEGNRAALTDAARELHAAVEELLAATRDRRALEAIVHRAGELRRLLVPGSSEG